ncbi:MAG: hypothetical protein IT320_27440 [Anaerolineae bacterium]|nr:hypothetical protein [Anaerolineae bacterium]
MHADPRCADQVTEGARPLSATRIAASVVGVYAGLLGAAHGYFELRQGATVPGSIAINAIGAPCQPEAVAHACWPAMTLLPNLRVGGSLAILIGLAALAWATFFISRERRTPLLFALGLALLPVGGGFLPPIYAMMAAAAATQIDVAGRWWRVHLSDRALRWLAALWPSLFIVYFAWIAIQTFFSHALNRYLLAVGPIVIPVGLAALALSIISAFACDIQHTNGAQHYR